MTWVVVPAAGCGARLGGDIPKQYLDIAGAPLIQHTLRALTAHASVEGVVVVLAANDALWPGWREFAGKPIVTCNGGA
jgi:2-C-methyl-D-erythritol 4-phosphate cytidylyltransferase